MAFHNVSPYKVVCIKDNQRCGLFLTRNICLNVGVNEQQKTTLHYGYESIEFTKGANYRGIYLHKLKCNRYCH